LARPLAALRGRAARAQHLVGIALDDLPVAANVLRGCGEGGDREADYVLVFDFGGHHVDAAVLVQALEQVLRDFVLALFVGQKETAAIKKHWKRVP